MSDSNQLPEIGSEEFWILYDEFCKTELVELAKGYTSSTCLALQEILRTGHGQIVKLPRPEKGWQYPKAWVVLRYEDVMNKEGTNIFMVLEPGDVMTREFGWDRDVFITHSPIIERVSGDYLPQGWPNARKGLFLPLYDRDTIMNAIKSKLEQNTTRALKKATEEARDWRWY